MILRELSLNLHNFLFLTNFLLYILSSIPTHSKHVLFNNIFLSENNMIQKPIKMENLTQISCEKKNSSKVIKILNDNKITPRK